MPADTKRQVVRACVHHLVFGTFACLRAQVCKTPWVQCVWVVIDLAVLVHGSRVSGDISPFRDECAVRECEVYEGFAS